MQTRHWMPLRKGKAGLPAVLSAIGLATVEGSAESPPSPRLWRAIFFPLGKRIWVGAGEIDPASHAWEARIIPIYYARGNNFPVLTATAGRSSLHAAGAGVRVIEVEAGISTHPVAARHPSPEGT